jgi:hypothetical protein
VANAPNSSSPKFAAFRVKRMSNSLRTIPRLNIGGSKILVATTGTRHFTLQGFMVRHTFPSITCQKDIRQATGIIRDTYIEAMVWISVLYGVMVATLEQSTI